MKQMFTFYLERNSKSKIFYKNALPLFHPYQLIKTPYTLNTSYSQNCLFLRQLNVLFYSEIGFRLASLSLRINCTYKYINRYIYNYFILFMCGVQLTVIMGL